MSGYSDFKHSTVQVVEIHYKNLKAAGLYLDGELRVNGEFAYEVCQCINQKWMECLTEFGWDGDYGRRVLKGYYAKRFFTGSQWVLPDHFSKFPWHQSTTTWHGPTVERVAANNREKERLYAQS